MGNHDMNGDERRQIIALKDALEVYLSGQSGIRFDALMRFAGPLFDLYDIEWKSVSSASHKRDRQELSTMVGVLDTARLLWCFFALDEEESIAAIPELEDALLGTGAGDEERSNLLVLLSLLEEHWRGFSPDELSRARQTPGYTLPAFDVLLSEYVGGSHRLRTKMRKTYGPEGLDLPEALAVFAEPLLDVDDLDDDPDRLEGRVARAQAYWDLANAPKEVYPEQLDRLVDSFAHSESERLKIRKEAERMVLRYHELFSEHGTAQDER